MVDVKIKNSSFLLRRRQWNCCWWHDSVGYFIWNCTFFKAETTLIQFLFLYLVQIYRVLLSVWQNTYCMVWHATLQNCCTITILQCRTPYHAISIYCQAAANLVDWDWGGQGGLRLLSASSSLFLFSVDCSAPTAIPNGVTPIYSKTTYEQVAVHTCVEGFGFDDYGEQHEPYCEIHGYWSDIPASCVGKFIAWNSQWMLSATSAQTWSRKSMQEDWQTYFQWTDCSLRCKIGCYSRNECSCYILYRDALLKLAKIYPRDSCKI